MTGIVANLARRKGAISSFLGTKRKLFKITDGTRQTPFYPGPNLEGYQLRDEAVPTRLFSGSKKTTYPLKTPIPRTLTFNYQ
jgi:hypothetical protein